MTIFGKTETNRTLFIYLIYREAEKRGKRVVQSGKGRLLIVWCFSQIGKSFIANNKIKGFRVLGGEICVQMEKGTQGSIILNGGGGLGSQEAADLNGQVHLLPCVIKYDGPCSVSDYFKPKSTGKPTPTMYT